MKVSNEIGFRIARGTGLACAAFALLSVGSARADSVAYLSNTVGQNINAWDITTNTINLLTVSAGGTGAAGTIDSLMFVSPTEVIYTIIGGNQIGAYTCSSFATNGTCGGTSTNTILSGSSLLKSPGDVVADPASVDTSLASSPTFLVSNSAANTIDRVNIATGATTQFADFGGNPGGGRPDGLAYDGSGNLFVVLGEDQIAQVNPLTGAIIKSLALPNPPGASTPQADGLTYDSATGFLYVASDDGGVYQVNTGLTTQVYTQLLTPEGSPTAQIDGIASLGNTLYLVHRNVGGFLATLSGTGAVTGAISQTSPVDLGADDIAPATFGSIVSSPEPGTWVMTGAGMLLIGLARRPRWMRKHVS